jgi:hypothetical protein
MLKTRTAITKGPKEPHRISVTLWLSSQVTPNQPHSESCRRAHENDNTATQFGNSLHTGFVQSDAPSCHLEPPADAKIARSASIWEPSMGAPPLARFFAHL